MGFLVRHMAATVAIAMTAFMLILSGITGIIQGVTEKCVHREMLQHR
jgi:hypothetical protein